MDEKDLRTIVEEVVKVLGQKGLIKDACSSLPQSAENARKTTIGTAGKVFSDDWQRQKSPISPMEPGASPQAPLQGDAAEAASEHEHTGLSSCPQCAPVTRCSEKDLKALGADRIAICRPTKEASSVARFVDHTLLKPYATQEEVAKLCEEARSYCFAAACINPSYVAFCAKALAGSGVKICTVVGFPLGSTTSTVKAIEARDAIANGASEFDMVINIGALKSGNDVVVYDDIKAVRDATRGKVLKVILETSLLSNEEKVRA